MSDEIERLIKIQGIINKNKYHLAIRTDLEKEAEWRLYQMFVDYKEYMNAGNTAILNSQVDTIEDLITYLEKHNGILVRY